MGDLLCDEEWKTSHMSSSPKTSMLAMEMVVGNKTSFRSCLQPLYVPSLHTRSSALCPHIYLQVKKWVPFLSTYFYNYYDIIKFNDYTIHRYREWEITSQTLLTVPFTQHWRGVINCLADLNSLLHVVQTSFWIPCCIVWVL